MSILNPGSSELLFVELLQIAVGTRDVLSRVPNADEWKDINNLCMKHAMPGVGFYAIHKVAEKSKFFSPPMSIIANLYAINKKIIDITEQQIGDIRKLTWLFAQEGFGSCILKGSGLATLYPKGIVRMPGDIDIWAMREGEILPLNERRKCILELCRRVVGKRSVFYHHTDLPIKGKDIEVHFTPSWMFAPWYNKRLQDFFEREWKNKICIENLSQCSQTESTTSNNFYVPSVQMNAVYVLLHIYRHLFDEGIGLRQVIDYYFVLKNEVGDKERVIRILKSVGLYKFAGAMMWVLHEVLNMPKEYMLCPADEARGRQLLDEIMQAGNFGKYDERLSSLNRKSLFSRLKQNINRNIRLMRYYPSEAICSPFWKIWQKLWQLYNGYGVRST